MSNEQRAAEVRRAIHQTLGWPLQDALIARELDAAEARGRAEVVARVTELAAEIHAEGREAEWRAAAMARTEENVRHHTAERRHARVAVHAADRLRALAADLTPAPDQPGRAAQTGEGR